MPYSDFPTFEDYVTLASFRDDICVSIYVPTTPLSKEAAGAKIALKNLCKAAVEQLIASGKERQKVSAIEDQIGLLIDDDVFWAHQSNSLAVLVNPEGLKTFRLPNQTQSIVEVSNRFHLAPLLRTLTFPYAAYILALSQGSVRLLEVFPNQPPKVVAIAGLPDDAPSSVGRASVRDRSPNRRIHGSEGQKVLLRMYARRVDEALRGFLAGRRTPLILAAVQPLDAIFRSVCSYPHLARQTVAMATDSATDLDLATRSREILDAIHNEELSSLRALLDTRTGQCRVTYDIATAARAATFGAVEALFVDVDAGQWGTVNDDDGQVSVAVEPSAASYNVINEIAGRTLISGGKVLGLREDEIPGGGPLAAILRFDPKLPAPLGRGLG